MAYKIKPFCLGCHYCALECPTHAIDYVGTQYQIDPDKCVECGKCVEVCNVSAIDTGKPEVVMPHAPKELEADCVVIGAGAGGTVAAVKLAELTGKKIIVLANLKPARFSGVTSEGMLLAATNNACGCQVIFVDDIIPEGTRIC